jgi:hypothetical protein
MDQEKSIGAGGVGKILGHNKPNNKHQLILLARKS